MLGCCIWLDLEEHPLLPIQQPAFTVELLLVSGVIRMLLPHQCSLARLPIRVSEECRCPGCSKADWLKIGDNWWDPFTPECPFICSANSLRLLTINRRLSYSAMFADTWKTVAITWTTSQRCSMEQRNRARVHQYPLLEGLLGCCYR